eukprot:SAG31_NODE_3711_length_3960_cov_5.475265_3_plen_114_part_00
MQAVRQQATPPREMGSEPRAVKLVDQLLGGGAGRDAALRQLEMRGDPCQQEAAVTVAPVLRRLLTGGDCANLEEPTFRRVASLLAQFLRDEEPDTVRGVTFSFFCNYSRNTGL